MQLPDSNSLATQVRCFSAVQTAASMFFWVLADTRDLQDNHHKRYKSFYTSSKPRELFLIMPWKEMLVELYWWRGDLE